MASPGEERPSADHRDGCRGFTGPFPPPLWMSNMKLLSRILTDSCADVPPGPGLPTAHPGAGGAARPGLAAALPSPGGPCDCQAPDTPGVQPRTGLSAA